jgi:hypothetical protein
MPVDDRDLLPADPTAADPGQEIEISPVLRDAKEPHPSPFALGDGVLVRRAPRAREREPGGG